MHWIYMVGLIVIVAALAALSGAKPSGTKPVARTRLMQASRWILLVIGLVVVLVMAMSTLSD
jgi:hypothetical protein